MGYDEKISYTCKSFVSFKQGHKRREKRKWAELIFKDTSWEFSKTERMIASHGFKSSMNLKHDKHKENIP